MSVVEAMQNGLVCAVMPVGEIANYAKDMETAIFMGTSNKKNWLASLEKIVTVIQNQTLYKKIGKSCYDQFRNASTYSDTLVTQLKTANWHDL